MYIQSAHCLYLPLQDRTVTAHGTAGCVGGTRPPALLYSSAPLISRILIHPVRYRSILTNAVSVYCTHKHMQRVTVMRLVTFIHSEKVTKVCNSDGHWFRHPESNRLWSNYTQCSAYTEQKRKVFIFILKYSLFHCSVFV